MAEALTQHTHARAHIPYCWQWGMDTLNGNREAAGMGEDGAGLGDLKIKGDDRFKRRGPIHSCKGLLKLHQISNSNNCSVWSFY